MKKFIILINVLFSLSLAAEEVSSFNLNGNAKNAINSAFDGVIVGNVTPTQDRFGNYDSAMQFAYPGYIDSNGMSNYDFGKYLSISFWVKYDRPTGYIMDNITGYDRTIQIRSYNSNSEHNFFSNIFRNNTSYSWSKQTSVNHPISLYEWHHVVITNDPYDMKLYIDNVMVTSTAVRADALGIGIGTAPLRIGTRVSSSSQFQGTLDDIRMYNHALSVSEIDLLYNDDGDGYSVDLINKKNIKIVDKETTIPSAVLISNHTLESADIITWSSLTFPNGNTIYKQVIKKYTLPAKSERTITTRPIIYSWYPKGDYIFKYYLANENVEGGDITFDQFNFTKE